MGQSFDSSSKKIGELLGSFERRVVAVPRFQRGYSWERPHVATFWNDVVAFSQEYERNPKSATYFFGPVVVQNQLEEIHLLDGQQRLATVTILLAVIRDTARTLTFTRGEPGHDLAHEIKSQLIQKDESDPPFALRLGELDQGFYQAVVQTDPREDLTPTLRSHELIRTAYKDLRQFVGEAIAGLDSDAALKKLKHLKDSVAKGMLVVAINVESEDDAYSIFETLNDRGLRLSVPDLLLNLLMRRASNETERGRIRDKWNEMLEQMGRRDIDRFLRHMWLSRYGDLKAKGLFNALKDHLRDNRIQSLEFAESCALDCDYYVAVLDQTTAIPKAARSNVAGLVKYLGVTSSLPMLLSGLQCLTDANFSSLIERAVALAVRYTAIADLNPATLESVFYEAARRMRTADAAGRPSADILRETLTLLDGLWPGDDLVREKAQEAILTRAPALWIMTRIAQHLQSATGEIAIGDANLEHIFPRNGTVAQWPNKADLEPYLWRLGNLTILGEEFNRSASNKAFSVKAANYYSNSELVITKSIQPDYQEWTPREVEARSAIIAGHLVQTFAR